MRILHVITGLQKAAGTSVFCGEVCNQLVAAGHDVTIAVCDPTAPDVHPLDPRIRLISIESILRTNSQQLTANHFSLIHIHALWTPILHKVACWARRNRIPVVWSPHGMLTPWAMKNKWWKKCLGWYLYQKRDLKSAALLHATAESEVEDVRRMGLKNQVVVAPLGVRVSRVEVERCRVERQDFSVIASNWYDIANPNVIDAMQPIRIILSDAALCDRRAVKKGVELSNLGHAQAEDSTPFVDNKIAYYFARVNGVRVGRVEVERCRVEGKTLLFVSRVQRKKGLPMLLEAWANLKEKGKRKSEKDVTKGWHIRIVGPDQDGHTAELMSLCDRLGLSFSTPRPKPSKPSEPTQPRIRPQVEFVGPLYGDDLTREYAAADLFVLPTHSENFGSVVIESLAQGVPVVCTKGAPWEDLETYKCGRWVDIGVEPIVAALSELLKLSTAERREMGERGRRLVKEKYTWEAVAKRLEDAYEGL